MYLGQLTCAVLLALVVYVCNVQADEADVHVISSGYCSAALLRKKGVDPSKYKSKFIFDPKKITIKPKKPTIPGCFHLSASNVTLTESVTRQVTGEFEMRLSGDADPSKPCLQCKKRQPKCGCGEKDSCMYCDFCKNFKKLVHDGTINNKEIDVDSAPNSCDCNIPKGSYTIDVEVCTPDEKELGENVPTEVLDAVTDGNDFSISTVAYIYDFRFNSLAHSDNSQAAKDALKARKARGLIGCYVFVSNVSV